MAAKKKAKRKATKKPARKVARKAAPKFKSLAQVRAAIDAMDKKIVPLLCQRLYLVTQAAQFKPSVEGVVVQSRVEEVVNNAKRIAAKNGGNPDTIGAVYRVLIDAFTVDEQNRWRELHGQS
jgi:isochorismate pyruvate lyase